MPSMSATYSIALRDVQPPACSWARHRIGITAEAWRPSGIFGDLLLRPGEILRREGEARGLSAAGARRRTLTERSSSGSFFVAGKRRAEQRVDRNHHARRFKAISPAMCDMRE